MYTIGTVVYVTLSQLGSLMKMTCGPDIRHFPNNRRQHHSEFQIYQRKFRSQTSDNMERWKAQQRSRVRRWTAEKRSRVRRRQIQRRIAEPTSVERMMQPRENDREVAKCCFYPLMCGLGGSKSRLAKAAGAEPCLQSRNEKLHAMLKNRRSQSTYWASCGKMARGCGSNLIFKSKCTNTPGSDHTLKLPFRKIVRDCSGKRVFNSKCTKHTRVGPLLEVQMFHAAVAWTTFASQNVHSAPGLDHFWKFRCR